MDPSLLALIEKLRTIAMVELVLRLPPQPDPPPYHQVPADDLTTLTTMHQVATTLSDEAMGRRLQNEIGKAIVANVGRA